MTALAGVSRKTESIVYQSSRTVRRTKLPQGGVRRMSLAVLLDQDVRWEGTGANQRRVLVPPTPERVKVIRDLVAAATGFSAERGDQLIVESLPFGSTLNSEPPGTTPTSSAPAAKGGWLEELKRNSTLVMIVAGAVAGFFILVGGLLFMLRRKSSPADVTVPATLPGGAEQAQVGEGREEVDVNRRLASAPIPRTQALTQEIRSSVTRDSAMAAQNVRRWLNEERA
jgi:flagellar M-ring protein FliF